MELVGMDWLEARYAKGVYQVLNTCEGDFMPPLSQRNSTHQGALGGNGLSSVVHNGSAGVQTYFDEMAMQSFVIASEGDKVISFLSYIKDFPIDFLDDCTGAYYVSTICTLPELRKRGIGTKLYTYLEEEIHPRVVTIRTWSTNTAQLDLLRRRGYQVERVIENDRGPGVDTVYFAKYLGC